MTLESSMAFFLAVLVLGLSPGPAIIACIARGFSSGFRSTLSLNFGIILGDVLYLLFALFGLSEIAQALREFFIVVKIVGGGYLVWLGWQMWTRERDVGSARLVAGSVRDNRKGFFGGLFITIGNPQNILFYLGFLPAFLDLDSLDITDSLLVISIQAITLFSVNATYSYVSSRGGSLLRSERAYHIVNKCAGAALAAVGGYVAVRS